MPRIAIGPSASTLASKEEALSLDMESQHYLQLSDANRASPTDASCWSPGISTLLGVVRNSGVTGGTRGRGPVPQATLLLISAP